MLLGYLGIDQYGKHYTIDKYPRKELMEQCGYKSASIMYIDLKNNGHCKHGYVIGPYWIKVLEVHSHSKWDVIHGKS